MFLKELLLFFYISLRFHCKFEELLFLPPERNASRVTSIKRNTHINKEIMILKQENEGELNWPIENDHLR